MPDAAVETVDAPDWIYKDDTLRVSALARLDNLAGKTVKIELLREQTVVQTQTIVPTSAQLAQELTFHDRPPEPGIFSYQIRIPPVPGEAVADNNAQHFRVAVKKEKFQVLIVEDQPRWEYRYLANYLKRRQARAFANRAAGASAGGEDCPAACGESVAAQRTGRCADPPGERRRVVGI